MSKPAKNQALVTTWGRLVLGAFVFAWLNVAAQPCLMAMEMSAEATVAPTHLEHGSQHIDHSSDHAVEMAPDCGHCPPSDSAAHQSGCATMQVADCSELPQSNIESRPLKTDLKNIPGIFALANAPPRVPCRVTAPMPMSSKYGRLKFTDSPPLNIRYCVFLK